MRRHDPKSSMTRVDRGRPGARGRHRRPAVGSPDPVQRYVAESGK